MVKGRLPVTIDVLLLKCAHEFPAPAAYVLVHSAWHGGWCWRFVADRLKAGGARVLAPTLTGLGERAHLLDKTVSLSTHIRATKWHSHAFDAFLKEAQADKDWRTITLDCGHELMVDAPQLLADTLETVT